MKYAKLLYCFVSRFGLYTEMDGKAIESEVLLDSPTLEHFDTERDEKSDLENEYDFGSASSRRDSDVDSWETVSDELRNEQNGHVEEGLCFCSSCSMKSFSLSSRINSRSHYTSENLPENVSKVVTQSGATIYVIGTAHFSEASQEDVQKVIQYLCPDVVLVELCSSRVNVLKYDEESLLKAAQDVSLEKLRLAIKDGGSVVSGVMQLLLLSMSAHITKQLGMAPGGEFRVAAKQAYKIPGCRLVLGDRPIQATLGRAMASLSVFQKLKLGWHLIFSKDSITKDDVEKYKQKDMIAEMLAEMTGDFPELSRVFVLERDQYMAQTLALCADMVINDLPEVITLVNDETDSDSEQKTDDKTKDVLESNDNIEPVSGTANSEEEVKKRVKDAIKETLYRKDYRPVIVGVVGIGHITGIIENIGKHFDLNELQTVPPPSYMSKAFKITFRAAVVAAISWSVYSVWKWVKPSFT